MRFFLLVSLLLNVACASVLVLQTQKVEQCALQTQKVEQCDLALMTTTKLFNDCAWKRWIAIEGPKEQAAFDAALTKYHDDLHFEVMELEPHLMADWESQAPERVLAKADEALAEHDALGVGRWGKGWFILAGTNAVTYTVWTEWGDQRTGLLDLPL